MEFSSDAEMKKIPELATEFFEQVLFDEERFFVSDEATIWDCSISEPEELVKRCSAYYRTQVSTDDFKQPLWKLILELNQRRSRPSA